MKRLNGMGKLCLALLAVGLFFSCEMGVDGDTSTSSTEVEEITSKVTNSDGVFKDYFGGYDLGDIDLSYYTEVSGSWEIVDVSGNQKLQETAGSSTAMLIQNEIYTDDVTLIAKVKSQSLTTDAGIMARYNNSSNYYTMFLDDGQVKLKKKVSGSWTTLDSASYSFTTSTTVTLKMILDGTSIKGYVDGTLYVEASDSSISSGYYGVRTYKNTAYFDAFQIYYDDDSSSSGSTYPTQVLGITEKTWKINSFVGDPDDDPTYYDDITDSGVDYDTYSDSNYFYTDGEWTYFKCYRGLEGSSSSSNPRVELREMDGSGDEEYWTNEGTNSMEWTVRVDQLSTDADGDEGVTCFGQIHGPGDSVDDIIRVQFKGDASQTSGAVDLKISGYITEDVMGSSQILDDTYYLDTEYTFKITYNSDDYVRLYCDGEQIFSQKMDTDEDDNYFKVGNYVQQSKGASYDGSSAIVAVKDLTVTHE
ncbi:MAG: polysaccharide lyase family 7 protein [Spirochaetales bacterium]|nr:polysaccharide lyase family 7 protein [Spirochaetales bacterium]